MKRLLIIALAIGLLVVTALPAKSSSDKPKRGGTLTMAIRKDIANTNPLIATRSTDQSIRELMFEPLLGVDLQGRIQPNLAKSWEVSNNGKLYTFHLRSGVKFHDGLEMTADDVKFAMDYTMNPKNGAYGFAKLSLVKRVDAAGKYTLKVYLRGTSPAFLSSLISIQSFSVIPKGSLEEGVDKPTNLPPGTGPFKFVEWKPKQRIVFERFDKYWGPKTFVDRLVLRPIRNGTVRFTALRAGDVDIVERTPYEWMKRLIGRGIKGIGYVEASYAGFRRLVFNVASPPFNNVKLRQAVAHAVKKQEVMRAAFFGFGEPADQKYPGNHPWYIKGLSPPAYAPEKAKLLLKEAGYQGELIELMIGQDSTLEAIATVLQAQLRKVGMNIRLDVADHGSYTSRTRRGDFAFKISGANYDPDPSLTYDYWCQSDIKKRRSNASAYCDKEMETLLKIGQTEVNSEKRRRLYRKVVSKLQQDVPDLYIGFVPRFFTSRSYVKGFKTDGDGAFRWWGGGLTHTWLDK